MRLAERDPCGLTRERGEPVPAAPGDTARLRIGLFSGWSAGRIGGGQTAVVPLARGLRRLGHEVCLLETSRFRGGATTIEGLPAWREPLFRHLARATLLERDVAGRRAESPTPYDLALGGAQLAAARRLGLDVLYTLTNTNVVGVLRADLPERLVFVINLIGFGIDRQRGGDRDTFPCQDLLFRRPGWDLQIAATEFEHLRYRAVYAALGLPLDRLARLPHSFDDASIGMVSPGRRQELRADFARAYGDHDLVLLYPVNVYRRKNVELAIEAVARLSAQRRPLLLVTGSVWDAAYYRELLALAQALGVANHVRFLGGVRYERLVELFNLADVTLFTSHQETFGHGLVESLACGTPVVGPGWIPPCLEILEGAPGGYPVRDKHVDAVARTVQAALTADTDRAAIASAAVERYGNTGVAQRFVCLVEPLVRWKNVRAAALAGVDWRALYGNVVQVR